jgi:hypothetical protein
MESSDGVGRLKGYSCLCSRSEPMKLWNCKELFVSDYSACLILLIAFILLLLVRSIITIDIEIM